MTSLASPDERDLEVARLRSSMSDLVGLVALSAAWSGEAPESIGRRLGEALLSLLKLDFVLVEVPDRPSEPPHIFARFRPQFSRDDPQCLKVALHALFGGSLSSWPAKTRISLGGKEVSIATLPIHLGTDPGVVVAGTTRDQFPSDSDKLLLNIARNQALTALQEVRLREESRRSASEFSANALIEGIPGFVAILAPDGRVERVNRQILEYCGETLDELQNWGTNGIVHPEDMPHVAEIFGNSIAAGVPYDIEQRLRRSDGTYRWFGNRGHPLLDDTGRIVAWHVLLTDVDDRKRAEDEVRASETNLRQLTETIPQMLWSALPDGAIDYCNSRFLDYTGSGPDDVMGNGWAKLLLPEDAAVARQRWMHSIATGDPYEVEVRTIHAVDGTYRWLLTQALPQRDGEGRIVKWFGSCVDIHDRKLAEEALKASERHLTQIIDTIPAYVWSAEADGAVDFYNKGYLDYLGVPAEDIEGWDWDSVIHPDDLEGLTRTWKHALETHEPYETQMRVRRYDGAYRWCLSRTSLLKRADGEVKWFGVSIDIDEMIQAQEQLRESELNLRRLTETLPQNLFSATASGSVDYINSKMREWFGRAEEKIMAEEWVHLTYPEHREGTLEAWMGTVAAGVPYRREVRFLHHSGEYRWCEAQARPLRSADGAITAWHGVVMDIHDRKMAEEALLSSERNLRLTIDTIPALVWSANADGSADFFNQHYVDFMGRPQEDLCGWNWVSSVHPDDVEPIKARWEACRASRSATEIEARLRRHDGVYRWFLFQASPLCDDNGEVTKWFGVNTDIDEQKRASMMLAGERRLLEMIASGQPLREVLATLCAVVEEVLTGARCEIRTLDASGTVFEHVEAPSFPPGFAQSLKGSTVDEESSPSDMAVVRNVKLVVDDLSIDPVWAEKSAAQLLRQLGIKSVWTAPISSKEGRVLGSLSICHRLPCDLAAAQQDLIDRASQIASIAVERFWIEDDLIRRKSLLEEAERISETGSFYWDMRTNKLFWSAQMHRIYGLEEGLEPKYPNLMATVHPDDAAQVEEKAQKAFRGESSPPNEERLIMPDGQIKYISTSFRVVHHEDGRLESVGVAQDITRRRLAEDAADVLRTELAHASRAMSLGELAASIAHEVNQPLSGIVTNANTCLRMLAMDPPDVEGAIRTAQRSVRDGNRAAEVVRRLRALFRKQDFSTDPFDVNDAAREVISICAHELQRRGIVLEVEFDPDLVPALGDRIQLQQVILNLVLNAADATEGIESRPRQIFVGTKRATEGVEVSISDTGRGLSSEQLARVFDAFYTTKSNGMGIGLSVSKSIVERHEGRIWASANEDFGATFAFSIPCAR